ncbi:MAG: InlB B-repeat-containing protein [Bacilli bacterium]|nr:InlB B-repeat-containing protein [Bacilli bacterium]
MKNKNLIKLCISLSFVFMVFFKVIVFENTKADVENNDTSISENSILNYYLRISLTDTKFNLKKKTFHYYSNVTTNPLESGYIFVEDQIPDGLEFISFYGTGDGTIGATVNNSTTLCSGNIVDDTHEANLTDGQWNSDHTEYTYHGLHYNANTRTVSFIIENLEPDNCNIVIGIRTKTKALDVNQDKIDFYNYAIARINSLTKNSNLVHRYIGDINTVLYNVNYTFDENIEIDSNLLNNPPTESYATGSTISVKNNVYYLGYRFDGWTTDDVIVEDNKFVMPDHDVNFVGHFSPIQGYNVSYRIDGVIPEGYTIPMTKTFYPDVSVEIDFLAPGSIVNGYEFLGWEASDNIDTKNDKYFIMPNHDVEFVGRFVEKKYKVSYNFIDKQLPSNIDSLLPLTQEYKAGENVHIENIPNQGDYRFMGWDRSVDFKMPNEDVVVNGYWQLYQGEYDPQYEVSILNEKDYYRKGEIVRFVLHLANDTGSTFKIGIKSDIFLENASYVEGDVYYFDISEDTDIFGYYIFDSDAQLDIELKTEIVYASQYYNEYLYTLKDKEYSSTNIVRLSPKLYICQKFSGENNYIFGIGHNTFKITGDNFVTDISFDTSNRCAYVYLYPGTYHIKEMLPMEQSVGVALGLVDGNDKDFVIDSDNTKENVIVFINEIDPTYFIKAIGYHFFSLSSSCKLDTSNSSGN